MIKCNITNAKEWKKNHTNKNTKKKTKEKKWQKQEEKYTNNKKKSQFIIKNKTYPEKAKIRKILLS